MRMLFPIACLAAALAGCASVPATPPVPAITVAAAPAHDNLNAVLWMQRSTEYRALATQTFQAAQARLDEALARPDWDALAPAERAAAGPIRGLPAAIILDVDETVLDNSPYQARLVRDATTYDEVTWSAWVEERRARPLPGVVEFTRAAAARGIAVVYLSNRRAELGAATLDNLRAEGLPVQGPHAFLGLGTVVEGCEQRGSDKLCRRRLVGRDYRVLMQFGDQMGDFGTAQGPAEADQAALLEAGRDWFGRRWWLLPNPSYGHWDNAILGGRRDLSPEARQRARRDALDTAP